MGILNTYEVSLSQKMGGEMSFSLYPWKGNKIYGYFGLYAKKGFESLWLIEIHNLNCRMPDLTSNRKAVALSGILNP